MKHKAGSIVTVEEPYTFRGDSFKKQFTLTIGDTGKVIKNKMGGTLLVDFPTIGTVEVPFNILSN